MVKPNYTEGNVINLMSSISRSMGDDSSPYPSLQSLNPNILKNSRNIVLLILDGIGYEYLKEYGKDTILGQNSPEKLTTVFPSTTATAMTSFFTGLAPQQHAVTGWFIHLKELGTVATILYFNPRWGGQPFSKLKIKPEQITNQTTIFERIERRAYLVIPQPIVNSDTTKITGRGAKLISYRSMKGFFKKIKKRLFTNDKKKFIFGYWPLFDSLCHKHGVGSKDVLYHFDELNQRLTDFVRSIGGTDTTVIITADHGMIDTSPDKHINLKDHPQLTDTFVLPLSGEPRAAYCFVRPAKIDQFKGYIQDHLADCCDVRSSEELLAEGYFGLYEPHPKLYDRIGDYVLLMKDNYVIRDFLLSEEEKFLVGNHGGVHEKEMYVPLVTIKVS